MRHTLMDMNFNRLTRFWGILDFCSIGWYFLWKLFHGQVPFYGDIVASINTARAIEHPLPMILTGVSLSLYLTLIYSGYILCIRKPYASKVSYLQAPFRLLLLIPPSLFFITWPLKYLFESPRAFFPIMTCVILLLISESLKICTLILWRRQPIVAGLLTYNNK